MSDWITGLHNQFAITSVAILDDVPITTAHMSFTEAIWPADTDKLLLNLNWENMS